VGLIKIGSGIDCFQISLLHENKPVQKYCFYLEEFRLLVLCSHAKSFTGVVVRSVD